jgi:thiosulfate/3-mercaptopyruvate sulfurtransferase
MMRPVAVENLFHRVLIAIALGFAWTSAAGLQVPGPVVETSWLADHAGEVVILDVREDATSYLGPRVPPGKTRNLKDLTGHIPGAVSVAWKKLVTNGLEDGTPLKAMLPSAETFTEQMHECGVDNDSAVIVAGLGTNAKDQAYAARLYFTLKYFGHDNVALLDGGTAQWAKDGRPLLYTKDLPEKGHFVVTETRAHLIANTAEVDSAIESNDVQLVDCRTEDFYLGLNFKGDLVSPDYKGHLSGARTLPFVLLARNAPPATLFSAQELRDVAAVKGVDPDVTTIVYCNTGVAASLGWFALHERLGNEQTRLYDGSMHAWSSIRPSDAVVSLAEIATDEPNVSSVEGRPQRLKGTLTPSLQTLVDLRRDALRRRRNDYFDSISGRSLFQPAWIVARDQMVESYWETVRAIHRKHRDALRYSQDLMRDAYAPWSNAHRDWSELRHFQSQMDQLDRQELYEALRFTRAAMP